MSHPSARHSAAEILADARFRTAQDHLREDHARFVEEIIRLTEIPAPPFQEERRGEAYAAMFTDLGLTDVQRDEVGNVIGFRRGRSNRRAVVVAAHLDTVFPAGTDCTVRREGDRLFAPGVGDDTRGLAALLAYVRALDAAGISTDADLMFVGDVGEEGKGDLRGVRHLCTTGAHRERIEAFFTIDGLELDTITTTAIGSYRYRITFRGPGGHSFSAFGTPNPSYALGAVLAGMSRFETDSSKQTTFCASVAGGGTSINAIPEEMWVEVDLRSADPDEIDRLDRELRTLAANAAAAETERAEAGSGEISCTIEQIGNRPAGSVDPAHPIVTGTREALQGLGFEAAMSASSTDANVPMSLGIPAIRVGSGGTGGRAHSLDEWIDVETELSSRGLAAGLAAILTAAGLIVGS